jgi:signal peptidase I
MEKTHAPAQKTTADPPQLITDFTAYDTRQKKQDVTGDPAPPEGRLGVHWVGDLALECTIDAQGDAGEMIFELRKGGRRFQCRIDLSTGQATLSISGDDMQAFHPSAVTSVRGKGEHHIRFSNCDNELQLWVDDHVVTFNGATAYDDLGNSQPDNNDREPVGIASLGLPLRISHLRILRDIYYIAARTGGGEPLCDYETPLYLTQNISDQLIKKHPQQRAVEFPLQIDQFFMLGDNSSDSFDGRLWGSTYWVDRDLLVGKALCIYWPHSWHVMHTPWGTVPFPCFPNYQRMSLLR